MNVDKCNGFIKKSQAKHDQKTITLLNISAILFVVSLSIIVA